MIAIFPEIVSCAKSGDAEKLAVLVRKYFGGDETFSPRPDLIKMMRQAGLEVQELPIASQAALLAKDEKGSFRIVAVLNESVAADKKRFMLAHMLGHVLFDIQPKIAKGDWEASGFRENQCPMARYSGDVPCGRMSAAQADLEARADGFAAAILMPKAMVIRAFEKINDVEKAAQFFGVSSSCLKRRLEALGLLATKPINFIDAEQKILDSRPKKVLRQDIDPASQLKVDEARMPRSFAASTYTSHQTEKERSEHPRAATETTQTLPRPQNQNVRTNEEHSTQAPDKQPSKGMARIRELARRIDKSV